MLPRHSERIKGRDKCSHGRRGRRWGEATSRQRSFQMGEGSVVRISELHYTAVARKGRSLIASVHWLPRSVSGTATDWKTGFPDDEITQCDRHGRPFARAPHAGIFGHHVCPQCGILANLSEMPKLQWQGRSKMEMPHCMTLNGIITDVRHRRPRYTVRFSCHGLVIEPDATENVEEDAHFRPTIIFMKKPLEKDKSMCAYMVTWFIKKVCWLFELTMFSPNFGAPILGCFGGEEDEKRAHWRAGQESIEGTWCALTVVACPTWLRRHKWRACIRG